MSKQQPLRGNTGNPEKDLASMDSLVASSESLIRVEYQNALNNGILKPVVFVVDCEDENGSSLARVLRDDDAVDVQIEAIRDGGTVPGATTTLVHAFELDEVRVPV